MRSFGLGSFRSRWHSWSIFAREEFLEPPLCGYHRNFLASIELIDEVGHQLMSATLKTRGYSFSIVGGAASAIAFPMPPMAGSLVAINSSDCNFNGSELV